MKSIQSIKISNFQSHKNTQIDFAGPGCLTVITGPSDSGKSAVIRALRWVFYNVPQGTDYITAGEDLCSVAITFEDGIRVERTRSRGGINRYRVNDQTFEGFGTGVPLEVQQATGIRKLQIGDQNFLLNLSEQLDGPFLGKSVPGSARAKVLGKLAGTEEIDFAGKEVGTDLYRARRQKEDLDNDVKKTAEILGEYRWIPEREAQVGHLQAIVTDVKEMLSQIHTLKVRQDEYQWALNQICLLGDEVERLLPVDNAATVMETALKNFRQYNNLAALCDERKLYSDMAAYYEDITCQLSHIGTAEFCLSYAQNKMARAKELDDLRKQRAWNVAHFDMSQYRNTTLALLLHDLAHPVQSADRNLELVKMLAPLFDAYCAAICNAVELGSAVDRLGFIEWSEEEIAAAAEKTVLFRSFTDIRQVFEKNDYDVKKWKIEFNKVADESKAFENEYINLMSALGKCPTCGGKINIERLKEVI